MMEQIVYSDRCTNAALDDCERIGDPVECLRRTRRMKVGLGPRKPVEEAFPTKLYKMLDDVERAGDSNIISWDANGKGFVVYQPKKFAETWMLWCFNQSKYKSFQRQLNLYNFLRAPTGRIKGVYSHQLFIRGQPDLCKQIRRSNKPDQSSDDTTLMFSGSPKLKPSSPKNSRKPASPFARTARKIDNSFVLSGQAHSPTGVDTIFLDRQLPFTFEDDGTPESLIDPLSLLQQTTPRMDVQTASLTGKQGFHLSRKAVIRNNTGQEPVADNRKVSVPPVPVLSSRPVQQQAKHHNLAPSTFGVIKFDIASLPGDVDMTLLLPPGDDDESIGTIEDDGFGFGGDIFESKTFAQDDFDMTPSSSPLILGGGSCTNGGENSPYTNIVSI